ACCETPASSEASRISTSNTARSRFGSRSTQVETSSLCSERDLWAALTREAAGNAPSATTNQNAETDGAPAPLCRAVSRSIKGAAAPEGWATADAASRPTAVLTTSVRRSPVTPRNISPVRRPPLQIIKKGSYVRPDGLACLGVAGGKGLYVIPAHVGRAGACADPAEVNADGDHSLGGQHVRVLQPLGLEGCDIETIVSKGVNNRRRHRRIRGRTARDGAYRHALLLRQALEER